VHTAWCGGRVNPVSVFLLFGAWPQQQVIISLALAGLSITTAQPHMAARSLWSAVDTLRRARA